MPKKMEGWLLAILKSFVDQHGPGLMYKYLGSKTGDSRYLPNSLDYNYARLALGVVEQNTISGKVAFNYMKAAAAEQGQSVDQEKIDSILYQMAHGYLDALSLQKDDRGRIYVTRDISHEEAWKFHSDIFRKAGYGEDAWTLHSVLRVMPEADRKIYWNQVLASAGDIQAELELAGKTYALMYELRLTGSDEAQKIAEGWLDRIEILENAQAIIDIGSTKIGQSVETLFEGMSDFIFGKYVPQSYSPKPSLTVTPPRELAPNPPPIQPMPVPPPRRRRKRLGGRRPPTTAGGYNNGGHYSGGGGRLRIDP